MQLNSIVNACNHLYKFWIFKYFSAMHPRVMAELNMFGRKGNKQPFKNTALYEIIEEVEVFQSLLLSSYILTGRAEKGTLLDRVIKAGYNPINLIFNKPKFKQNSTNEDGLVDSLRQLLHHENYQKPWSMEHLLANLLTKAF